MHLYSHHCDSPLEEKTQILPLNSMAPILETKHPRSHVTSGFEDRNIGIPSETLSNLQRHTIWHMDQVYSAELLAREHIPHIKTLVVQDLGDEEWKVKIASFVGDFGILSH